MKNQRLNFDANTMQSIEISGKKDILKINWEEFIKKTRSSFTSLTRSGAAPDCGAGQRRSIAGVFDVSVIASFPEGLSAKISRPPSTSLLPLRIPGTWTSLLN